MFCKNCGKEIDEKAFCCPNCGALIENLATPQGVMQEDKPSAGFAVLSFFIPLVGLVLWLTWRDKTPLKAKSCGKWALIGFIANIVISVLTSIVSGCLLAAGLGALSA